MLSLSVFPASLSELDTISLQTGEVADCILAYPSKEITLNCLQDLLPPAHPTPAQLSQTNPFPVLPHPGPELSGLGAFVLALKDILYKRLGYIGGR